jgi:hypothetical protein
LKKWSFALAAVAAGALIGCSGSGGSSGNGGGNGGNTGDSNAFVTIPNVPGQLQNVYLTGQGRVEGDEIAVIRRVTVDDTAGVIQTLLNPFRRLQLNGYTQQMIQLNVPSTISRPYDHYNLEVNELDVDTGGGFTVFTGQNQPFVDQQFDARFRIFPGRQTSMAVRLDDSMFPFDNVANTYVFDRDQFILANYSQDGLEPPRMNGFLSDYVMFDLSNLTNGAADQPAFPDASGTATALFINGDNFAIGQIPIGPPDQATADPLPFFTLTPIGYVEGKHVGPRTAIDPSTGQSTVIPGTYSLVQPDPRQPLNPASRITALQGTYKNFSKTINSLGSNPQGFEIIAFPSTKDDGLDDIVLFNISGGTITKMYFGQMDMNAGTISAFPVNQITDPSNTANEITGTVSNLDSTDMTRVHSGRYALDATNLPATFSASGRFIVYRR